MLAGRRGAVAGRRGHRRRRYQPRRARQEAARRRRKVGLERGRGPRGTGAAEGSEVVERGAGEQVEDVGSARSGARSRGRVSARVRGVRRQVDVEVHGIT